LTDVRVVIFAKLGSFAGQLDHSDWR